MSFLTFFYLFESSSPFDAKAYQLTVDAGQALASNIEGQVVERSRTPIPDDVKEALVHEQLIAAIEDPVDVLRQLARYLAMKGEYWAAGKLQATYNAERRRKDRDQSDRRKGARSVNARRKIDKAAWVEATIRAAQRIIAAGRGMELSDSALAKRIVASKEFRSLRSRRPSWNTVRAELKALGFGSAVRQEK